MQDVITRKLFATTVEGRELTYTTNEKFQDVQWLTNWAPVFEQKVINERFTVSMWLLPLGGTCKMSWAVKNIQEPCMPCIAVVCSTDFDEESDSLLL